MDIKKSDLIQFGKAYDIAQLSCFVLNSKLEIIYTNDYAIQLFGLNNTSVIGESFSRIWPNPSFLNLINHNDKPFEDVPKKVGDLYITWKTYDLSVDNKSMLLLLQENKTDLVKLNEQLDEKCKSIIGHSYKQNNPPTENYINEIINYLFSIIDKIPCYIYWKNSDLKYLGCNKLAAEFINFKSSSEIIGKSDFDIFKNKSLAQSYRDTDKEIIETGVPILNEIGELSPDNGEILNTLVSKVPMKDLSGNIVGLVGISVDITELKKTHEELKKAKEAAEASSKAKSEFIANMSHDFRTPLTGVIGLSSVLETQLDNPEYKQEAHLLSKSGEQLLTMINEILDDVKADSAHEADIHEEPFDLYKCIQNLIELESPTTVSKHLGLKFDIKPDVPQYIISDRKKIHHILLNLLGNAVKFTTNGHITIEISCLDSSKSHVHLQFGVADTGIGIPDELQNKVFERFFRVDPSYKGRYAGYGLGLHIVQSYVSLLGGHITLTSREGVGTTFHFDLRCKICDKNEFLSQNKQEQQEEQVETVEIPPTITTPYTSANNNVSNTSLPIDPNIPQLLLIEDNPIALNVLEAYVIKLGCQYSSANDAETALEMAKQRSFDLIITDIGLPGMEGTELTHLIRDDEKINNKKAVPIVGLSGHAPETIKAECMACGMNDIFRKPVTLLALKPIIERYAFGKKESEVQDLEPMMNPSPAPVGKLGIDLPDTEDELFMIDSFSIFDIKDGLKQHQLPILVDYLKMFISEDMQHDIHKMEEAYLEKDWERVEKLAHKIKGGVVSIGTSKMHQACLYLERYYKAGHREQLDKLYHQLIDVNCETVKAIKAWLQAFKL